MVPQSQNYTEEKISILQERATKDDDLASVCEAILEIEGVDSPDGYVYVAEAKRGEIKIGKSKRPRERLKSLSTGSPADLELLAKSEVAGSRAKEAEVQRQFDDYRVRGEWFEVSDSVRDEIINTVEQLS